MRLWLMVRNKISNADANNRSDAKNPIQTSKENHFQDALVEDMAGETGTQPPDPKRLGGSLGDSNLIVTSVINDAVKIQFITP